LGFQLSSGAIVTSIISSSGSDAAGRVSISSLDTNGDGIISSEELEAAKSGRTQDPTVSSDSAATGAQSQVQSSMISMLLQVSSSTQVEGEKPRDARDLFSAIDADGDGKITQDEFVAARPEELTEEEAVARFAELDEDQTGYLTEEAFAAAFEQPLPPLGGDSIELATDDTVSILDILSEMQRVIDAYRENDNDSEIQQS
jgi:Ca2+-binding EF-hand superfamily protein